MRVIYKKEKNYLNKCVYVYFICVLFDLCKLFELVSEDETAM